MCSEVDPIYLVLPSGLQPSGDGIELEPVVVRVIGEPHGGGVDRPREVAKADIGGVIGKFPLGALLSLNHTKVIQAPDLRRRVIEASEPSLSRVDRLPASCTRSHLRGYGGPRYRTSSDLTESYPQRSVVPSLGTRAATSRCKVLLEPPVH